MLGLRADRETAFHAFISIFPLPILTIMSSNVEYRKEFGEDVGNMFTQTSLSLSLSALPLALPRSIQTPTRDVLATT